MNIKSTMVGTSPRIEVQETKAVRGYTAKVRECWTRDERLNSIIPMSQKDVDVSHLLMYHVCCCCSKLYVFFSSYIEGVKSG